MTLSPRARAEFAAVAAQAGAALTASAGSPEARRGRAELRQASPASTIGTLMTMLDRIGETLDQETAALQSRQPIDLADFNRRKSQGLLELTRKMRALDPAAAGDDLRGRVREVRAKLDRNQTVLRCHLAAVQEVSAVIARAIEEAESDGTYSQVRGRRP